MPSLKDLEPGDHSFTFAHFPIGHGGSIGNHPGDRRGKFIAAVPRNGKIITNWFIRIENHYEFIGDVRGPGLMIGCELVKNRKTKEPAREEAHRFIQEGLKRGVIFGESKYLGLGNIVKVKPPLVIKKPNVSRFWMYSGISLRC